MTLSALSKLSRSARLSTLGLMMMTQAHALDIDGAKTKDLIPEQRVIAEIEPNYIAAPNITPFNHPVPQNTLRVTAWVNHNNSTYRVGDKLQFFVKANEDAYITMIDVGTSGKAHILYPNNFQTDNFVRAGEIVQIPQNFDDFDIRVHGPAGKETIKVIATREPLPLYSEADLLNQGGPFKSISKDLTAFARDLSIELRPQTPQQPVWDEYTKVITIK